jgi:tetratricopeptide (TPR) repeat protein
MFSIGSGYPQQGHEMRALFILAAVGALLLPQAPSAFAQSSTLERARQARSAGRIDEAEPLLREVLRAEPDNYLGLYNMGLVYEQRAIGAPTAQLRLQHYRTAADWLERARRSPGRRSAPDDEAFTIFNSLGAMYLGLGDLAQAARYFREGLRHRDLLDNESRAKLFTNIGYMSALAGNNAQARDFFQQGANLGNRQARENLRRMDEAGLR